MRFPTGTKAVAPRIAVMAAALLGLGALLTGCAHETATTTIHANGSWTRRSVYTIAEADGVAKPKKAKKNIDIAEVFAPPSGSGWKVERKVDGEMKQLTITAQK